MMTTPASAIATSDPLAAFEGEIAPVRVPFLYRLGLLLIAVAMVLLPLIYVALIALVGWGTYSHAVHNVWMLSGGSGIKYRFLAYVAPIVVGAILVLFMVKPLFAPRRREARPTALDAESEPTLFAFVERICRAVGAPFPRAIHVDCEVNASASFRRGLISLLSNDLVLTIGLPLVEGLTLRQLAGVLAHEFGHFAQGAGMRLTYIIRSANHWFARVVFERDAWDVRLEHWAAGTDLRVGWMLHAARGFVWLTRRILQGLMWVGHGLSCFMLRQMEFDADRYEARLAGSATFESTVMRLHLIQAATNRAHDDLRTAWQEGRLADDFPRLIGTRLEQVPKELEDAIDKGTREGKTGLFDTHPCDADRIRGAWREQADGVFRLELPAAAIFADFARSCREATGELYQGMLGDSAGSVELVSSSEVAAGQQDNHQLISKIQGLAESLAESLHELRKGLSDVPHPFDGGDRGVSLADQILGTSPTRVEDVGATYGTAEQAIERCYALYNRVLGSLVNGALAIEQALGLPEDRPVTVGDDGG